VPPTEIGWAKPLSMHNEPIFANFAFVNVQPRLNVVVPGHSSIKTTTIYTHLTCKNEALTAEKIGQVMTELSNLSDQDL
jgi:hypothetical protein